MTFLAIPVSNKSEKWGESKSNKSGNRCGSDENNSSKDDNDITDKDLIMRTEIIGMIESTKHMLIRLLLKKSENDDHDKKFNGNNINNNYNNAQGNNNDNNNDNNKNNNIDTTTGTPFYEQ